MAVSANEQIFLGHTPSEQRKFLVALFGHLRETHKRIHIPAAGEFTMAKCAIEAGYKPGDVHSTDISLFTRLLGALYSGTPVDEVPFSLSPENEAHYADVAQILGRDDLTRVAFVMWLIKTIQMRKIAYQRAQVDDLVASRLEHVRRLREKLAVQQAYYAGSRYEHKDLREVLNAEYEADELVAMNPPVYTNGYAKMFEFGDDIEYDPDVPEFNWGKEYRPSWEASHDSAAPFLWYRAGSIDGYPPEEIIFTKEYNLQRQDAWLFTKPELLEDFGPKGMLIPMPRKVLSPIKAPAWGPDDVLTRESVVSFRVVPKEVALYYRDLWAHKLGNTAAEQYMLMLVDGKVFATLGIMLGDVYRLKSEFVFENYGFNAPSYRYPTINRLLMWCITSAEFGKFVKAHGAKINRYWTMKGLRTTCLSRYRKVKLNNGILEVEKREKLEKTNLYKIMYEATFRPEGYRECVGRFMDEVDAAEAKKAAEQSAAAEGREVETVG